MTDWEEKFSNCNVIIVHQVLQKDSNHPTQDLFGTGLRLEIQNPKLP